MNTISDNAGIRKLGIFQAMKYEEAVKNMINRMLHLNKKPAVYMLLGVRYFFKRIYIVFYVLFKLKLAFKYTHKFKTSVCTKNFYES